MFDPEEAPASVEIRDIYSYANYDICPMLRFEDTSNGAPIRLAINQTTNFVPVYMRDTRLFSDPNVILKPGINHIIAMGRGKLTIEMYEEMI